MVMAHRWGAWALVACLALGFSNVPAQTPLLSEIRTVADPTQAVPVEETFTIANDGSYTVTLLDLGATATPAAPLTTVKAAIINASSSTVVATLTKAGTTQFNAKAGSYRIHVIGDPGSSPGAGPINIQISDASNTSLYSFFDNLARPTNALPSNTQTLDDSFTVPANGNYTITLADLQLPQALTTLTLVVTTVDGTLVTNPPLATAGSETVALQQNVTYRIFAIGQADSSVNAGLFSAYVVPAGGGAPAYAHVVPVGTVAAIADLKLTSGASYTFKLADLSYPGALGSLKGVVVVDGLAAATLAAAGSSAPFTAIADDYQVYALASPGTSASSSSSVAGSYSAIVQSSASGSLSLNVARAVASTDPTSAVYSFDTSVSTSGTYTMDLADFGAPSPLAPLSAVVVQNGAVLGTPSTSAGSADSTVAAGSVSLLVFTQSSSSGGLFGIDLSPKGGDPIFQQTQGVGQLFASRQFTVTAAGSLAVQVADLAWPASFSSFAALVTRGATHVGSVYGGGAFAFAATPGTYTVSFIAQPTTADKAGTYSLSVAPGPTATLTSDSSSVASGGTVNLTWGSQNADSCVASGGGWTGTLAASGTAASPAITSATTFTVTCSGEGVTATQSVNITIKAATGGGGGALSIESLLTLAGLLGLQLARRRYGR